MGQVMVELGLRPSLHAAAKKMERLPVTLAALYEKITAPHRTAPHRTELQVLRALVHGSATRLESAVQAMSESASLTGWQLRILDGNHLPASYKRLVPLRGHTPMVYEADQGLVIDMVACAGAHESERVGAAALIASSAQPGQSWIADRNFCTRTLLQGWQTAGAGFIVCMHTHPSGW